MLFASGSLAVALVTNALAPMRRPDVLAVPSFFAGWLTGDLPIVHGALYLSVVGVATVLGALELTIGWVGLGLTVVAWMGLVAVWWQAGQAGIRVDQALTDLGLRPTLAPPPGVRDVLRPFHVRRPGVQRTWRVEYARVEGRALRLDVYRPAKGTRGAPVLLFVHGGAWLIGFRDRQGRPLLEQLAEKGNQ